LIANFFCDFFVFFFSVEEPGGRDDQVLDLDRRILLVFSLSFGVYLGSAIMVGVGHEGQDLAALRVLEEVSGSDGSVVEILAPGSGGAEQAQILVRAVVICCVISDGTLPKIRSTFVDALRGNT